MLNIVKHLYINKKSNPLILIILLYFVLFLLIPLDVSSQERRAVYIDSITFDEDGNRLYFPSFVYPEPVMDEIYVMDGRARVIIYNSNFFPIFTRGKMEGVTAANAIVLDQKGYIYIANAFTQESRIPKITILNPIFEWEGDIYISGFEGAEQFQPYKLALDKEGNIYVAGMYVPNVLVLDRSGNLIDIITPMEGDKKVIVNNVTIDNSGRIYILSEEESKIYVYDQNRQFLFKFGEKGGSTAKLSRPKAVAVDDIGKRIYVVDYMRHSVNIYDYDGVYISEFGGLGWSPGWFSFPSYISIDNRGRLFVADTFNNRVQVFKTR